MRGREDKLIQRFCRGEILERPRRRWKSDIKMAFKQLTWKGMDLIHLVRYRALMSTIMSVQAA
jgi:hypothetical protein